MPEHFLTPDVAMSLFAIPAALIGMVGIIRTIFTARLRTLAKPAAAAVLCMTLGFVAQQLVEKHFKILSITNSSEQQQSVELPDGTIAHVNRKSSVTAILGPLARNTWVQGEVRFKIAKNKKRPFVVRTRHATTVALGTVISIHTSPTETEIVDIDGNVEVLRPSSEGPFAVYVPATMNWGRGNEPRRILQPGDVAVMTMQGEVTADAERRKQLLRHADTWPMNELKFESRPLAEVIAVFNRYYDR